MCVCVCVCVCVSVSVSVCARTFSLQMNEGRSFSSLCGIKVTQYIHR